LQRVAMPFIDEATEPTKSDGNRLQVAHCSLLRLRSS